MKKNKNANTLKNSKQVNTTNETRIKQIDNMIVICFLLMLLIIPTILKLHEVNFVSPTIADLPELQPGQKYEIYTFYKSLFLTIFTLIASVLFLIKIFFYKYEIKKTMLNIFLPVFILILLLSTSFSPYKYIALFGNYDRHEGALTFICYSFIIFMATNIKFNKKTIRLFFYILTPFLLINSALILLDFLGYHTLNSDFVKGLIYSNMADQFSFGDNSSLKDTLYNVDYLSGIASLFICLFFILSIFEKRRSLKIANLLFFFISVTMLLSSLVSSGFLTVIMLLPIILIFLLFKKEYKKFLLGISLLISCTFIYLPLQHHNEGVWNETFGNFIHSAPKSSSENKPIIPAATDKNEIFSSKLDLPKLPENSLSWGNGRGYIWKNTLPIVMKQPLSGYGLDTLSYVFPQMNSQQLSGLGTLAVVDKPHSLFLDIAYGTGIIGLIAFLLMISTPILKASYSIIKTKSEFLLESYEVLAIIFVLLAYLIQGIVNDSNLGTDIIFIVFLGVLNSMGMEREKGIL
jgi:O-antigen ligase